MILLFRLAVFCVLSSRRRHTICYRDWSSDVCSSDLGWFRTGDLARLLPGGFVAITGRERERILRGGYSVFPAEVEAVLLAHPDVAEAAVLGVPHAEPGDEGTAFVALRPGAACDAETR